MMSRKRTIADTIALCLLIGLVLPTTWLSTVKADTVNFQFQVKVVKTDFSGWAGIMVEVWGSSIKIATGKTDSNGDVYLDLPPGGPYEFRAGDASTTALVGSVPSAALVGVILMPLTVEYPVTVLDTTAPVVTITAPADGAYYTTAAVPAAAYTATDANPITVVESGYLTSEGVQTYTVTATDGAGNVGSASVTYTVDNVAPVVSITAPLNGAFYKTANVPVGAFTVADANPYTTVEAGWANSPDGSYTYTVTATDGAGNSGSASVTYTVDNVAPVTTKTLTGTLGSGGWYVTDVGVTLTAIDNVGGSGVKEIHYILDSGTEQTVSGSTVSFTITEGAHSLEHWAVDNAGNEETHVTQEIKIVSLGEATAEINSLKDYAKSLYDAKKIGKNEYNKFTDSLNKIGKDIDKAMKQFDRTRYGFDDRQKGFEDLRQAVMKFKGLIKQVDDWAKKGKIPEADATKIINDLEAIRMKLVNKANAEALAEKALARKAIADAKPLGKDTTKAEEEITKVDTELDKAIQEIAKGNLSQAIQHFKHAFTHSQHAIKKAYDKTWTDDYKDWIDELEEIAP